MKNIVLLFIDKISFQTKTTILMWIISIGFALIIGVGLLALIGLKSEFDISSFQNHNIHMLMPLAKSDTYKNVDSLSIHLRDWYAQTFMLEQYNQIRNLLHREHFIGESIDKAFAQNDTFTISSLLKEQLILSLSSYFYYSHNFYIYCNCNNYDANTIHSPLN